MTNLVSFTGSVPSNGSMGGGPNMGGGNSTVPFTGEGATMSMGGGFVGMMVTVMALVAAVMML